MRYCPYCNHNIRYRDFLKWLEKGVHPFICPNCGHSLLNSGFVMMVLIFLVLLYFSTDYIVEQISYMFAVGFFIKVIFFLGILLLSAIIVTYFIFHISYFIFHI